MADVNRGDRPLSPHVSIYKFPLNATMSILHRATGVAMTLAAVLIVWWFMAAASSPEYFESVNWYLTSFIGDLILLGSMLALWYHFANGLRHLIWDTGAGFEDADVTKTAYGGLGLAAVLTILTIIIV